MPARYALVHFVPDPVRGERLNIGVIAWGPTEVRCKFASDWRRVRAVSGGDISYLRQFVSDFHRRLASPDGDNILTVSGVQEPCVKDLEKMVARWSGNIQFSDVRGSLKSASEVVSELAAIFLPPDKMNIRRETRKSAVAVAAQSIRSAVTKKLKVEETDKYVFTKRRVDGRFDQHEVDVVVANGALIAGVQAISFRVADTSKLEKDIDSLAWSFDDIARRSKNMKLGLFVLPPKSKDDPQYRRAKRLFPEMKVEFLEGARLDAWALRQANVLRAHTKD